MLGKVWNYARIAPYDRHFVLRQSYERKKIAEVRWIYNKNNPANARIKANDNSLLEQFVSINKLIVRMDEYVERPFAKDKKAE
jgi:hypothetical protein